MCDYLGRTKSKSKSKNRQGSSYTAARSEIVVTRIQIILYYSTLVQKNVSLLLSFRDQYPSTNLDFLTISTNNHLNINLRVLTIFPMISFLTNLLSTSKK